MLSKSQTINCTDEKNWNIFRSRPQNTEQNTFWTSPISPWVWCSWMGNSIKIKLWQRQQSAEPGIKDHYWYRSTPVNGNSDRPGKCRKQNEHQSTCASCEIQRLENHPRHKRLSEPTKCRLKWSSFLHDGRRLERQDPEVLQHVNKMITSHCSLPAWKRELFPEIWDSIPGINQKGTQTEVERTLARPAHYGICQGHQHCCLSK